jgi:hypothetical protein
MKCRDIAIPADALRFPEELRIHRPVPCPVVLIAVSIDTQLLVISPL